MQDCPHQASTVVERQPVDGAWISSSRQSQACMVINMVHRARPLSPGAGWMLNAAA